MGRLRRGRCNIRAGCVRRSPFTQPVHCAALARLDHFLGSRLLFIDESADFLAAVQIIVYGGAIVILFLFVIKLLGVDRREPRKQDKMPRA